MVNLGEELSVFNAVLFVSVGLTFFKIKNKTK